MQLSRTAAHQSGTGLSPGHLHANEFFVSDLTGNTGRD
jgi:hypothetical protein